MGAFGRTVSIAAITICAGLGARAADYKPVTSEMLVDPPADDRVERVDVEEHQLVELRSPRVVGSQISIRSL